MTYENTMTMEAEGIYKKYDSALRKYSGRGPTTGEVRDYIYSGFSGDRSGIQTATRGSTNIAVAMSRKKK